MTSNCVKGVRKLSNKLNPNDQELSFKERILRDLEMLKAQIEESDDQSLESNIKEQTDRFDDLTEHSTPAFGESDFSAQLESSGFSGPIESDQAMVSDTLVVPDFVARQIATGEVPPPPTSIVPEFPFATEERPVAQSHHVPLTFNEETSSDANFMETEISAPPLPKRSGDKMANKKTQPASYEQPINSRRRSQAAGKAAQKSLGRKKSKSRNIVAIVFSSLFIAVLGTAVAGYFFVQSSLGPIDSKSTETVQVEIVKGSSVKDIGQTLEKAGLIRNATVFDLYVKFNNLTGFQSGYHNLQKSMTVDEIITALQQEGTAVPVMPSLGKITIPEGYTIKQIAEAITLNASSKKDSKSPFTAEEFLSVITDEEFISEMQAKYPDLLSGLPTADLGVMYRLEGYLFPATYEYHSTSTVRELVEEMIAAMDANLRAYYETIASKGLTVNQVLSIASLVEKEGSTDEDRRHIASVFFNRIQWGIPLQSNIAVLYAEGKLGEKITLEEDVSIDTQIDSPYNGYVHLGFMPGPVDSPSASAIKATIEYPETEYFYFVADVTTGQVYFANTLEEHEANVATYVNSKLETSTTTE